MQRNSFLYIIPINFLLGSSGAFRSGRRPKILMLAQHTTAKAGFKPGSYNNPFMTTHCDKVEKKDGAARHEEKRTIQRVQGKKPYK